jgi:signal transduction histidine kinase
MVLLETSREKIHLSDLIKTMDRIFVHAFFGKNYILQYYLSEELPLFEGDPNQIKQIIIKPSYKCF